MPNMVNRVVHIDEEFVISLIKNYRDKTKVMKYVEYTSNGFRSELIDIRQQHQLDSDLKFGTLWSITNFNYEHRPALRIHNSSKFTMLEMNDVAMLPGHIKTILDISSDMREFLRKTGEELFVIDKLLNNTEPITMGRMGR